MITKFDNFLNESTLSDVLYHRTRSLVGVLKSNKILLSTQMAGKGSESGKGADSYSKKPYFLSFSRTRNLKIGYSKNSFVTIVFDGKALNTKYKGGSVDYWAILQNKDTSPSQRSDSDEFEDRLYSDSPYLGNLDKYIKSIDILTSEDKTYNTEWVVNYILNLKTIDSPLLKKIRIFRNINDFNYNRNWISIFDYKVPVDFKPSEDLYKEDDYYFNFRFLKNVLTLLLIGDKKISDNEYVENFIKKYFDKFSKLGVDKLKNVDEREIRVWRSDIQSKIGWVERDIDNEFYGTMSADISDVTKGYKKSEINYEVLKLLTDEMSKYKVHNLKDLVIVKQGGKLSGGFIDYSQFYSFVYHRYDRFILIDNEKESNFEWYNMSSEKEKNKLYDMGYPITNKNVINFLFNNFSEKDAMKKIKLYGSNNHQDLVDLRGKLIFKEITELDYFGEDVGDRMAWNYVDVDKWYQFIYDNIGKKVYDKKITELVQDKEIKIRFLWAITEKLIGIEKTKELFESQNLTPLIEKGKEKKYIMTAGKSKLNK